MERPDRREPLGDGRAGATRAELGEVAAEVGPRWRAPADPAGLEPGEVRADRGPVGALRVRGRVAGGEARQEPLERRGLVHARLSRRRATGAAWHGPWRPAVAGRHRSTSPGAEARHLCRPSGRGWPRFPAGGRPGHPVARARPDPAGRRRAASRSRHVAGRERHGGTALQAEAALVVPPGDRAAVDIVDRAQRLARGREVALRVARAAPEDRAGPAGATRHEVALGAARACHRERELLGRRRAVLLDVGAVRVAVAADERPEPAPLGRQHAPVRLAAGRTGLAHAGERRELRLLAGDRPRLLVLGVQRAGEEPPVAAEPDHHRVAQGADLVGRLGGEVAAPELLPLLVDERPKRRVERPQERHPGALAAGDLVELLLHPGREREVHVVPEVLDQQVGHDLGDRLRVEPPFADRDVARGRRSSRAWPRTWTGGPCRAPRAPSRATPR